MEPISLGEMDGVALMNRVDTKYLLSIRNLSEMLAQVHSEYRVLEVEGLRVSPYATLYFDTPECMSYVEHHNGKLNRRKYRMRKYLSSGVSFLEIKTKNNKGRTDKRRIALDDICEELAPVSTDFIRSVTGVSIDLMPQMWTQFSRVTLVSRHCAERVTLDWDLEFHRGDGQVRLPEIVIVEVKQETDDRWTPVREQLRRLSVRPMRVSKYCLGSILLRPELKRNRFKKKLLAINKVAQS